MEQTKVITVENRNWRYILVNATIPKAAFYTYQYEGNQPVPYHPEINKLIDQHKGELKFQLSGIGDAFTDFQNTPLPIEEAYNDYLKKKEG